ncbi:Gfo/Idh/MocA family oxidoreductase [Gracilibacillus sp. YIM 98692]|uniref:Gfo/Idh/MocA family protein n=1 Tax=Gracilibacillus sp. YIM 98692 TaxID=2663532 RepID=UPI001F091617|nr:Gfo/Idh/MocA family oxidoreductase [Gracilibacillus sp. YIM 98692]
MRFSIIGCQHPHISIFIEEMIGLGHECVGIYEPENVPLAQTIAERYSLQIVQDMEPLLDETVEVVGCASINNEKINIIEKCERYGKHIMIDKPAVVNRQDFNRLKAVAERGNIQIGMLLTERFRPSIYTLKKQIDEGSLGDIVSISMRKPHQLNPSKRPSWHFSREQSGGIIIDLFIHDIDLLRWLTGDEINSISSYMAKNILPEHPSFYDAAGLQIVMNDGVTSQLYADWHTPDKSWTWGDCRIYVVGTQGVAEIRLEGDPFISEDDLLLQVSDKEELSEIPKITPPFTLTEDFLYRIRGEKGMLGHQDLLAATEVTVYADEQARKIKRTGL